MMTAKTRARGVVSVVLNGAQRLAFRALHHSADDTWSVGVRALDLALELDMSLDKAEWALDDLVDLGLARCERKRNGHHVYILDIFRDYTVRGPFMGLHKSMRKVDRFEGLEYERWQRNRAILEERSAQVRAVNW